MKLNIINWFKESRGATAVEFALVSVPFIVMLVGIVETSLFFATGFIIEGAANDAARLVRTGQAQEAGNPAQAFEDLLCDRVKMIANCNRLKYEVVLVPGNTFLNADDMEPSFNSDGELEAESFDPGGPSDTVMIRVAYSYDFLTPLLGQIMRRTPNGPPTTLLSTMVIKNEPYRYGR